MSRSINATLVLTVALLSAGCTSEQQNPMTKLQPEFVPQPVALSRTAQPATQTDLVYVSSEEGALVSYNFPRIKGPVGSISEGSSGLCSDKRGNVWASEQSADDVTYQMVEYAHGGTTPIAQLSAGPSIPYGCSVDPHSGDLAVATFSTYGQNNANVAIYRHAQGAPKTYSDPNIEDFYACAYDASGNLLVQGYAPSTTDVNVAYTELRAHAHHLVDISLRNPGGGAAGVQWDGAHFVIGYLLGDTIFQIGISGSTGSIVGQTKLDRAQIHGGGLEQFWIQGNQVVATTSAGPSEAWIAVYPYPEGSPRKHSHALGYASNGLTVSVGPKGS